MPDYKPREDNDRLLREALQIVRSVPYEVTTRWVFYQMVQLHGFPKSAYGRFKGLLSKARHAFWQGWRPDVLADDTREIVDLEDGYDSTKAWLDQVAKFRPSFPSVADQKNIVQVWFEAAAMRSQFEHYLGPYRVDLVPFGGDPSIRHKWNVARRLHAFRNRFMKPIVVLYFGDLDPKGLMIPESALRHIWQWTGGMNGVATTLRRVSDVEWKTDDGQFRYVRIGLNEDQVGELDIPENPDKPGTYQWEALRDEQARDLILEAIAEHWSPEGIEKTNARETAIDKKWKAWAKTAFAKIEKEVHWTWKESAAGAGGPS